MFVKHKEADLGFSKRWGYLELKKASVGVMGFTRGQGALSEGQH